MKIAYREGYESEIGTLVEVWDKKRGRDGSIRIVGVGMGEKIGC
jgi:hypothetical protein